MFFRPLLKYILSYLICYVRFLKKIFLLVLINCSAPCFIFITGVPISTVGQHIVSKIVDHLLDMLIHLINKNHDAEEHTLPKLMIILTDIKNLQKFSGSLKKSIHDSVQGDMCNIPTMLMQLLQSSHIPASRISTNMQLVELELD